MAGTIAMIVLTGIIILALLVSWSSNGDSYPVYALFETLQILSHLTLLDIATPGRIVVFLEPFVQMTRFNFFFGA